MTSAEYQSWQLQLSQGSMPERALAAENLSYLGEEAAFAAVDLVKACGDQESVRDWAVAALEELGAPRQDSAAALAELTTSENSLVAYWAITLLGRLGPAAKPAQQQLASVLENPNSELAVREKAVWALGQIGPPAEDVVPVLRSLLQTDQPRLAKLAEQAITQLQAG